MEGEEKNKEKEEEKEKKGGVKEEEIREGVTKVDIVLDCESKKSDAKDVCRQLKATNIKSMANHCLNVHLSRREVEVWSVKVKREENPKTTTAHVLKVLNLLRFETNVGIEKI